MNKRRSTTILAAVVATAAGSFFVDVRLAAGACCGGPTDGDDIIHFQGMWEQLTMSMVNPYSGEVIEIDGMYTVNSAVYDGLDGYDILVMSNLDDALFLENADGEQTLFNIELIVAGSGSDIINLAHEPFTIGDIIITGEAGNDILWGNVGNDTIYGGDEDDTINGGPGNDILFGDNGNDTVRGGTGDDIVDGGAGDDVVDGGDGDDVLIGGGGNDAIDGGEGIDTVSYEASTAGVTVDLSLGTATGEGTDTLVNIENVTGSNFVDTIIGDDGDNVV